MKENSKKIINRKSIYAITIIIYIIAMLVFEIGYCNAQLVANFLNNQNELVYNFSLCRILIYIAFIIVYCIFKDRFINEAETVAQNKYKRIFIYLSYIATIISIIILSVLLFRKPVCSRIISIITIAILMWDIFITYISNNAAKNIIVVGFSIGLIFSITTRFNHAIDEKKHFMTAFNMACFNFDYAKNPITDENVNQVDHFISYVDIDELLKDYTPQITKDVDIGDTPSTPTSYNFLLYVFPSIGVLIAKTFGGSIIDMYILGRIFNLLFYILLISIAIKIIPYKKNIFLSIFLLPMMILFAGTFSIDGACIGLVSIFVAYCLKVYKESETISLKQFLILCGLFALMLLAKSMAYVFVGFIVFMLPIIKTIKKNKKYLPIMIIVAIIAVILVTMLALYEKKTKIVSDNRVTGNINVNDQLHNMIVNPMHDIKLVVEQSKATLLNFDWYSEINSHVFFGENSRTVFLLLMLFIIYVAISDVDYNFKIKDKIIMIISFMLVFGMTSVVLYISYTEVGALKVDGYQTRYIVPILPLVLFAISNNKLISNKEKNKNRTLNITIISGIFIFVSILQNILLK